MAKVHIAEPVAETRELLERLVVRLGHEHLLEDRLGEVDALIFEPSSPHGVTLARRARRDHPHTALVAVSSIPVALAGLPGQVERLIQPFQPADLERALTEALRAARAEAEATTVA